MHPQHHALIAQRAQIIGDDNVEMPMQEWRYLRIDGSPSTCRRKRRLVRMNGSPPCRSVFMDITARKQAEESLRENEARFRALTSLSSDWYWEQDEEFRFVRVQGDQADWNEVASQHFMGATYLGKTRWEMGETHLTQSQWEQHRADLPAHREFRDLQLRFEKPDGSFRWASVSGMPIFDAQGVFRGYRGIGRDITAQKAAQEQINALAFYDALTNLPNRRLLIEQLKQALVTHVRSQQHAALLFIDLDNFKTLNDTLGHETGDLLLQQVAQRLLSCVREADTVARLGGDEFVVMLQGLSPMALNAAADAEHVGHKILDAFAPPFALSAVANTAAPPASASPCSGRASKVSRTCSSRRIWPCTRPRLLAATRCACSTRACRPPSMRARPWSPTCARRWRNTSSCCITSRWWTAMARSVAPKPWCVGSIRSAEWCRRGSSSRSPSRRG